MADAAISGGDPNMALSISQSVLKEDPDNVDALVHEGDAYYALDRCLPAQAAYQTALRYDAKSSPAETGVGRCLLKSDPAGAEQAFLAAVAADPGNAAAWSDIGVARDLQGNFQGAVQPYQQSILINPGSVATVVNLGLSLALSGHGAEALQYLGPLATGQGATPKIREDYAAALIAVGDDEKARTVLAIDLPPDQVQQAMDGFSALIANSIANPAPPPAPAPTQPVVATPPVSTIPAPSATNPPVSLAPPPATAPTPVPAPAAVPAQVVAPVPVNNDPDAAYTGPSPIPGAVSSSTPGPVAPPPVPSTSAHPPGPTASIAAPVPASSSVVGSIAVQLGALNSSDEAKDQWNKMSTAAPTLFQGKSPDIREAEVKGQTYYRLRTNGFSSNVDAARFCGEVSAAGYACTVANF
ncbi:MAG: SPOR domain-containing protein [Rhodospirillales bacterium]|nr:SPOR domain-containing protein [Rhodospirillales bacterium]